MILIFGGRLQDWQHEYKPYILGNFFFFFFFSLDVLKRKVGVMEIERANGKRQQHDAKTVQLVSLSDVTPAIVENFLLLMSCMFESIARGVFSSCKASEAS